MKTSIVLMIICFCFVKHYGQVGELDRFDCNYSKEIIVPFNYSAYHSGLKPQLNQTVFYSYRDQFTYWYRIVVKENKKINFKVSAINDSDSYVVFVYKYNNTDFCGKLYAQKIKPLSASYYVGKGSDPEKLQVVTIEVQKDQTYYISVLNTSLNNCGHQFNLNYGTDTLKVKAFHLPCKKDISTISLAQKTIKPVVKIKDTLILAPKIIATVKDTVKVVAPVPETKVVYECWVKDSKKPSFLNAGLIITDVLTKDNLPLENIGTGKWKGTFEKESKYKLKCTALGYKDLETQVDLSKGNPIEIWLEPLKAGDNFIMKSIYFHPNTYALRKESADQLQSLLQYLVDNPTVNIEIQGHTNGDNKIFKNRAYETLGEEWNFQGSARKLSLKRAEAIKQYLVNNGIAAERLSPQGYGGSKSIIKNPETMEEGQRNIRVEALILKN